MTQCIWIGAQIRRQDPHTYMNKYVCTYYIVEVNIVNKRIFVFKMEEEVSREPDPTRSLEPVPTRSLEPVPTKTRTSPGNQEPVTSLDNQVLFPYDQPIKLFYFLIINPVIYSFSLTKTR